MMLRTGTAGSAKVKQRVCERTLPRLVAIIGGSGAGKTYLAARLEGALGRRVLRLALDDFYRDRSRCPPALRSRVNFDHPRALDWPVFQSVLERLAAGKPAWSPRYDFATHTRLRGKRLLKPKEVILVEGLWPCHRLAVRRLFDLTVFLACPASVRFGRRLERDRRQRGRSAESVLKQFRQTVAPMHQQFVLPQMRWADIILRRPLKPAEVTRLAGRILQFGRKWQRD